MDICTALSKTVKSSTKANYKRTVELQVYRKGKSYHRRESRKGENAAGEQDAGRFGCCQEEADAKGE